VFLKNSRYASTPQVAVTLADGTQVAAVQLRAIPATVGDPTVVTPNDRLDVMSERAYGDAIRYWHIADANSALDSRRLFVHWLPEDQNLQPLVVAVPEN